MSVYDKVKELQNTGSGSSKVISQFLLDNGTEVKYYSLGQISDMVYTSKSSLVRYAQKLGYPGWNEFIEEFLEMIRVEQSRTNAINANLPFKENDKIDTIVNNLIQLKIETLQYCANTLDRGKISQAARIILRSRHVFLFGSSPNSIYGELFQRRMQDIGIFVTVVPYSSFGVTARFLQEDDCAIIISYSGGNPNRHPIDLIPEISQHTKNLIGITGDMDNIIVKTIPCTITIPVTEKLYTKLATFSTAESTELVLDAIYSACFASDYQTHLEKKVSIAKITEASRTSANEKLKED